MGSQGQGQLKALSKSGTLIFTGLMAASNTQVDNGSLCKDSSVALCTASLILMELQVTFHGVCGYFTSQGVSTM